ncbi:N-acyltransferase YncA [Raoultella terrigena]|uniref:N-acyltransferase YncA n=1 Tax=Raoultella terrigena TaxID=577 RepID=A0A4U9CSC0_RAOTE|nr:N-acyltransferase YncA [Raoultella terrigena]
MTVRYACKEDCAAIAGIYNHAVLHTAAIWNDKTVDTDNRIAWFEARQLAGFPGSGERRGRRGDRLFILWRLACLRRLSPYRRAFGLRTPRSPGKRLGRTLLVALINEARRLKKHVMVAGIEAQNHASLHLHETLGFVTTGQMPQVGHQIRPLA